MAEGLCGKYCGFVLAVQRQLSGLKGQLVL